MKLDIYMDVDGVLRDLNAVFRRYYPDTVVKSYENEVFGPFWEHMAEDRERAKEFYRDAPVVKGASEGISWLRSNINPQIRYLTASGFTKWPWLKGYTEDWLTKNGFLTASDRVIFVQKGDEKPEIVNKTKSILFDDRADTINAVKSPSIGVWVESGLVLDRVRVRSAGNIYRLSRLGALTDGKFL